jgi:hypothetical protein
VDARGIPLSIIVTAANRNDITQLVSTLDAVVVPRPPVASRARQHLCADAASSAPVALNMLGGSHRLLPECPAEDENHLGKVLRRWLLTQCTAGGRWRVYMIRVRPA